MSDTEENDILTDMVNHSMPADPTNSLETMGNLGLTQELMQEIIKAKKATPGNFASYWELDEQDVNEATMEEINASDSLKMLWAAENNKCAIIEDLYEKDDSLVNTSDEDMYTPLHRASYEGNIEAAKLLITKGAKIDARTIDGWQPLHSACRWNQTSVAALLLNNEADINAQTNGGQTPLHLAASEKDSRDTLELLLMNKSINTHLKNNAGETAREICVMELKEYIIVRESAAEYVCVYIAIFNIAKSNKLDQVSYNLDYK
ncbi:unnamed protein product [Owenia fusiformis]|uniref:Ankyrin repeat domain-containing protein 49 n=1 Tax=Owenia fusiformis TaxID=6347 RepID=A0A8S4P9C9_OWEFU|nr:unnamed protein product [Owenia fusiformis]